MKVSDTMERSTILFVDDQAVILAALKRAFLDEPFEKLFASSSKEAFEFLEKKQIHVIVTDLGMPEMGGQKLLEIVMEKYPHIVRIVLSGQTDINTLHAVANDGKVFKIIPKPWKLEEEFKPAIRDAIEYYNKKMDRAAKQMANSG